MGQRGLMVTTPVFPADSQDPWKATLETAILMVRDTADAAAAASGVGVIPSDGITNCGPALQAEYDAGRSVTLNAKGTYLLSTAVFLDRADTYRSWTLNGNGAKIVLGPGLPTTDAFYRDPTTVWGFFANTKRQAGSVVVVDAPNRASGSTGNLLPVIFRNLIVAGAGANAGLVFGNRCGHYMDRVILSGARTLCSWYDYSDVFIFIGCHNRKDTAVTSTALCIQINPGDGGVFLGCKADGGLLIADLKGCHGALVAASVTGAYQFTDCVSIVVTGVHQECAAGGSPGTPALIIADSQVLIQGSSFYPPRSTTVAAITVVDSSTCSDVTLQQVEYVRFLTDTTADDPEGPLMSITAANGGTSVTFDGITGVTANSGDTSSGWLPSSSPWITSPTTSVQTAIDNGFVVLAGGNGELHRHGGGTTWALKRGSGANAGFTGVMAAPTMTAVPSASGGKLDGGSLTSGQLYSYTCALYDELGHCTAAITEVTATVTAARTVQLTVNPPRDGRLRVWRKAGTGVVTAATNYLDLGVRGTQTFIWDTGTYADGLPWKTSPPATPGANTSVRTGYIDGVAYP